MNEKIIAFSMALILILNFAVFSEVGAQAEYSLAVRVVDPSGNPLKNVEVYLIKGEEVRKFLTNSTGYAEFKHLEEGEYVAEVRFDNITLARKTVKVPEEREVELTALLSTLRLRFVNLDENPVKNLIVTLKSSSYSTSGKTDENGTVVFEKVPYSALEGVGEYRLKVLLGKVKLLEESLEVDQPTIFKQITLPLISLKLTIVNLEGKPVPKVSVKLVSGNFSASRSAENGTAFFENIPSSEVEGMGPYSINASIVLGKKKVTIIHEVRQLTSSQSFSLIADLAEFKVRVVDEEGEPLSGIEVVLSNQLAKDFTSAKTDVTGVAKFENIPLSIGAAKAGIYEIKALRAGNLIGKISYELTRSGEIAEIRAARNEVRIKLVDFNDEPLAGYNVTLIDDLTNQEVKAFTNEVGEAILKLFYGPYELRVSKGGRQVYSKLIQVGESEITLKLNDVNFPLILSVQDAFGKAVKSAKAKISAGDQVVFDGQLDGEPLMLKLPYPTEVRCDVYDSTGRLIHRVVIYADGPTTQVIRLADYIEIAGLMPLEALALAVALPITLILMASGVLLLYRRTRAKG